MGELQGILVNLDRCVGCYACELACKQEHNVPVGERWLKVNGTGPKEVNGRLQMAFLPTYTGKCDLCSKRFAQGLVPACVETCPWEALTYFDNAANLLAQLREGKRVQISKLVGEVPAYA